jgi:hypothetical protein
MLDELLDEEPWRTLRLAALLAGAGADADRRVADLIGGPAARADHAVARHQRTCVDAGDRAVLGLGTSGDRRFDVAVAGEPRPELGATAWAIHEVSGTEGRAVGRRLLWRGEHPGTFPAVLSTAEEIGMSSTLRADHAALGPRGRIYSVQARARGGCRTVAVGWQLDRNVGPAATLETLGAGSAWPAAERLLDGLVGERGWAISSRGPWSISRVHRIGAEPETWLGTSAWARWPETARKRRGVARVTGELGGDAAFAEAVYHLVTAAAGGPDARRVGRAVELACNRAGASDAAFYLGLPEARR